MFKRFLKFINSSLSLFILMASVNAHEYKIKEGDSLSEIIFRNITETNIYGPDGELLRTLKKNPEIKDEDLIHTGQMITISHVKESERETKSEAKVGTSFPRANTKKVKRSYWPKLQLSSHLSFLNMKLNNRDNGKKAKLYAFEFEPVNINSQVELSRTIDLYSNMGLNLLKIKDPSNGKAINESEIRPFLSTGVRKSFKVLSTQFELKYTKRAIPYAQIDNTLYFSNSERLLIGGGIHFNWKGFSFLSSYHDSLKSKHKYEHLSLKILSSYSYLGLFPFIRYDRVNLSQFKRRDMVIGISYRIIQ